jgi:hypothetical protein
MNPKDAPLELVFPPWADLADAQRAIVHAAAESIARQAHARCLAGRPPKVLRPGSEAHWKYMMVIHYLADIQAETL